MEEQSEMNEREQLIRKEDLMKRRTAVDEDAKLLLLVGLYHYRCVKKKKHAAFSSFLLRLLT